MDVSVKQVVEDAMKNEAVAEVYKGKSDDEILHDIGFIMYQERAMSLEEIIEVFNEMGK
ncbi:MAG: hypothetical protein ACQET8_22620 [Bacillota bacterium]